ncbi:MAG: sodium-dependent transporter [Oscillospiraceae bacterium]|nr:sodium-dependent transporter [Oscillospiraceae bacterium]
MQQREKFSSRLGFLLISAGCAIGLGNVWRFPYITGQYGGAAFVLVYLFFLVIFGLPIMAMEFSVGRASRKSVAASFRELEPKGTKWHIFSYFAMAGNYLLMMFYTTICGWMFAYCVKMARGEFVGATAEKVGEVFSSFTANPTSLFFWMVIAVFIGFFICSLGLQKGVEKITKAMMSCLFIIMLILVVRAVTLPGASEGLAFYLKPDFSKMAENGILNVVSAAMGQAFFTLSIGIGSMAIFGSYIDRDRSLMGESVSILALDTSVALMAGLIIFPACFAFNVNPGQGPGLVFVTLPNIFNVMAGGRIWGVLFFVFMSFAALSTVVAVFENIISFAMDLLGWSRKKAVWINFFVIVILSIPCVLGFNVWSGIQPIGDGSMIMDLEDFIVSNNLLPLGSLVYLFFCVTKYGWGWDNFLEEVNAGRGMKFPKWIRVYVTYILPLAVLFLFVQGYLGKFFPQLFS